MYRILVLALGFFLFGSQIALSEVPPVKYLAGKSEAGQPHLYWFGAAAVEPTLFYDDGTAEWPVYVDSQGTDNQLLVKFWVSSPFFLITQLSAYIFPENPSTTISSFALSVRKDTGLSKPGAFLSYDTVEVHWAGEPSKWSHKNTTLLMLNQTSFWTAMHWFSSSPANPLLGRDVSDIGLNSYVNHSGALTQPFIGNWMIRAKLAINDSANEAADRFLVYRGTDSSSLLPIATVGPGQFDYLDSPPTSGDYYYRVSRWDNDSESVFSNAIKLPASPTAVEDRQIEKHAFLLSEPFPNPTSASVLFTARTDKQMELGFSIYNLLGQKVYSKSVVGYSAGEHRFFWNGQDVSGRRLPSGLYLLRFQAGEEVLVKKITLLR